MPRSARYLPNFAFYHVIVRGNQRRTVFIEKYDYERYLGILRREKSKYGIEVFSYCLMPNHVHLIIRPSLPHELSTFMKNVSQSYAQYFNYKHDRLGHLWQGRFKSIVLRDERYLLDCMMYVEFNAVRAGLVKSPQEYFWSSYRHRVLNAKDGIVDSLDNIFELVGSRSREEKHTEVLNGKRGRV